MEVLRSIPLHNCSQGLCLQPSLVRSHKASLWWIHSGLLVPEPTLLVTMPHHLHASNRAAGCCCSCLARFRILAHTVLLAQNISPPVSPNRILWDLFSPPPPAHPNKPTRCLPLARELLGDQIQAWTPLLPGGDPLRWGEGGCAPPLGGGPGAGPVGRTVLRNAGGQVAGVRCRALSCFLHPSEALLLGHESHGASPRGPLQAARTGRKPGP